MSIDVAVPVQPNVPPFMVKLASRSNDGIKDGEVRNENWKEWNGPWIHTPLDYLWEHLHRTDAQGNVCQRVILETERRTPNGVDAMAVTNGMAWPACDRDRREIIIECVEQRRKEDAEAGRDPLVVQFYTGVINNGFVGSTSNRTSQWILDLDSNAGREKFKQAWFPWIECGILSGLGFDAGAGSARRDDTYALIRNVENWIDGFLCFTEAHPWVRQNSGIVTEWAEVPADIEVWCLSRYKLQRDPDGTHVVDRVGARPTWIASHPHSTAGNTAPQRSGTLTPMEAREFEGRGFSIMSGLIGPPWDTVVNLPPIGVEPG